MVVASGIVYAFNVIPNRMAAHVARDITEEVRMDLYEKTSSLSCNQVDRITIPSLISRITSDTYNVHRMLNMIQRLGVRAPILLVGGLISWFVGSRNRDTQVNKKRQDRGTLIASGFIAGGALMGVASALLKYFGADWFASSWSQTTGAGVLALIMYLLLILYFIRTCFSSRKTKN